jgi:hypothetical protein
MATPTRPKVIFKSPRFRPVLPDASQVNPGVYGAELAWWLCLQLAQAGVVTSYPIAEDWGWLVEYITAGGDEYWLGCGNVDGADDQWLCFLEPKAKGLFGRRKPPLEGAAPLLRALAGVLTAEPSVTDVQWQ